MANLFGSENFISWLFFTVFTWFIIYSLYSKWVGVVLRRMSLSVLDCSHVIDASWNAAFIIGSFPLGMQKLLTLSSFVEKGQYISNGQYFQEILFLDERETQANVTLMFYILCSYYVHYFFMAYSKRGLGFEFFERGSFVLFFTISYILRRMHLGLAVMMLINLSLLLAELTRVMVSLSRKEKPVALKYMSIVLFGFYCIFWSLLFLFLIPCHLLWTASGSRVANSDMPALAILKVSLWGYYLLVLVSSPLVKLFRVVLVPSHADKTHYDLLNKCLFPPKNDVMKRLRTIQEKARKHNRFADSSAQTRVDIGGNMKAVSFYQTIKCLIALRRKVRRNRERRRDNVSEQSELVS